EMTSFGSDVSVPGPSKRKPLPRVATWARASEAPTSTSRAMHAVTRENEGFTGEYANPTLPDPQQDESAMLPAKERGLGMRRHGSLSIYDRRKILPLVIHLGDETVFALLRVALGGLVIGRRQVGGQHILQ